MNRLTIAALRLALSVIWGGLLLAQVWYFPVLAAELAAQFPEAAWLRWPLLIVVILVIAVAEVAVGFLWALLTMTAEGTVFSDRAFRHVNAIIGLIVADTVVVTGVNLYLTFGLGANPPTVWLGLAGLTVGGLAGALLMLVMKGLLRQAVGLRVELSEVI